MSDVPDPSDDSLDASDLEQVIVVCERFETAWREGHATRIEDLRSELPERLRPRLFRELLALELELRLARGERPGLDEYRSRFPEHGGSIAVLFAALRHRRATEMHSP